jgi:hypothetical protein
VDDRQPGGPLLAQLGEHLADVLFAGVEPAGEQLTAGRPPPGGRTTMVDLSVRPRPLWENETGLPVS